ncbi:MAG: LUD domain-containing protein [Syntrophales bacterium]|jgi:L-lactate dehydrogenase complex protein LldF|nr:LUD domain-containing protein [Syntrophales bacterium]
MKIKTDQFNEVARREIRNEYARAFLGLLPPVIAMRRGQVMSTFPDPEAALAYGQAIRAQVVAKLPELLEEFEKNAAAHGSTVLWARNAEEANRMILKIAKDRNIALCHQREIDGDRRDGIERPSY